MSDDFSAVKAVLGEIRKRYRVVLANDVDEVIVAVGDGHRSLRFSYDEISPCDQHKIKLGARFTYVYRNVERMDGRIEGRSEIIFDGEKEEP